MRRAVNLVHKAGNKSGGPRGYDTDLLASLKSRGTAGDFFNSGHSMPWWLIGFSMVAATTATDSANFFTQVIRTDGMSGNWIMWAFILTGLLTVFVYAKLWVKSGVSTDIEFYGLRYSGKPAAALRAVRTLYLGVIFNVLVLGNVILAAIKIGTILFGIDAGTILVITVSRQSSTRSSAGSAA